jgi:hypothetical protein
MAGLNHERTEKKGCVAWATRIQKKATAGISFTCKARHAELNHKN